MRHQELQLPADIKDTQSLGLIDHQWYLLGLPAPLITAAAGHGSKFIRKECLSFSAHSTKLYMFHMRPTSDSAPA